MNDRTHRIVFVVGFAALTVISAVRPARADERADQVARELVAALGGEAAWDKARQLRFDFVVEREGSRAAEFHHVWDRYTGDYRLLGRDKSGAPYAVYFNVNTRDGRRMVQWQYVLGGAAEDPTTALWTDWRDFAGVRLSLEKPMVGKLVRIFFENVAVSPARDDKEFAAPAVAPSSPQ
jgi:hypothetical protein